MTPKIRVFLTDDHSIVRAGLRTVIEAEADMTVVGEAGSGPEVVSQVSAVTPDVVVLDVSMPGGGGIGAISSIAARSPTTRVLMLTMHEDPEYVRAALASGAAGFMLKNAAPADIVAAIRAIHRGRSYVDPSLAGAALRNVLSAPVDERRETPEARLSPREREVLVMLALGYTNKEIATRLDVSVKSVETYRARLSEKLGLSGRAEFVRYALENGLVGPDRAPVKD